MIKINLATRKQAVGAPEGKEGGGGKLPGFLGAGMKLDVRLDDFKELPLKKIAIFALVGIMASYTLDSYKEDEIKKVDVVLDKLNAESQRLKAELAKTRGYEAIKKQLDADELTLRTKIETIQKLLSDRQTPPKMVMTLSSAIPSDVWLNEFRIVDDSVEIKGAALSYNQISDFMRSLNESAYFSEVNPTGGVHQERDSSSGQEVNAFGLMAKRR